MADSCDSGVASVRDIDWTDPDAPAVDGFAVGDIEAFVYDSVVDAVCEACGASHRVEPDASGYQCQECGDEGSVSSPLVKLGLI